ncbi:MAG: hypothetical protein LLF96_03690 [Eubacteriales bacterium]|nr:hypothetical protein [Eubacteriales bacterium]
MDIVAYRDSSVYRQYILFIISGKVIKLIKQFIAEIITDVQQAEELAATVGDTEGVYMVPAYSGLGAPYFDSNARAAFVGIQRGTRKTHLVHAASESIAYQNADVIHAMERDVGFCSSPVLQLKQRTYSEIMAEIEAITDEQAVGNQGIWQCHARYRGGKARQAGEAVHCHQELDERASL